MISPASSNAGHPLFSHCALTAYRLSTSEGEGSLPGRKTSSVCPQAWGLLGAVRGWLETEGRDTCTGLISYTDSQWGHRKMITLDHWVGRRIRE